MNGWQIVGLILLGAALVVTGFALYTQKAPFLNDDGTPEGHDDVH